MFFIWCFQYFLGVPYLFCFLSIYRYLGDFKISISIAELLNFKKYVVLNVGCAVKLVKIYI